MKKAKKPGAKPGGGSAAKPKAKPGALKTAQEKRADDRRVETTLQAAAKRRSSRGGEAEAAAAAAKTATAAAAAAAPAPEGQAQSPGGEVVQSVGVGSTVSVRGCAGFVRYRGPVFFAEGAWLGVHFGEPHAEWGDACNGTVAGTTYFASEDKCALFVPESSVVEAAAAAAAAAAAKEAGADKGPQEFIDAATATLRVLSSAEANTTTTTTAAAAANSASAKKAPQQQQQQPQARRSSHGSGRSTSITSLKRGSLGSSARGSGRQLRPRPSQPLEPLGRKPAATGTVGVAAAAAAALPASQAPAVAGAVSPPLPPGPLPQLQPKQEGSNAAAAAAAAAAEAAAVDAEEQERGAIMAGWEAEAAAPCGGGGGSGKNAALLLRGSQQQQHAAAAAAAAAAVQLNPPCSPLPTLPQAPPQPEAAEPEPAPHTPLHAGGGGVGILAAATAPPEKQQTRSVVAAALLSDEPPQQPSEAAAGASPPPPPPPAARPAARPTAASHLQTAKRLLRDALHAVGKGEACLRGYNDAVEDCSEEAQRLLAVVTSEEGTIAAAVEEAFYGGGGEGGGGGGGGGASSNVRSLRRRIVKATGWAAAVKEGEEENDNDDEADSSSSSAAALFPPPAWRLLKEAAEEVQGLYGVAGRGGGGGGGGREVALVGEAGAAAAAAAAAPALPPLLVEIGGVNRMVGELEGRWRRLPEMGACVRGHEEAVRRLTHDAEEAAAQRAAAAASGDVERVEELYRTEAATVEALAAALRAMVERLDEVEPRLLHPFQEVASNLAAHHRAETATLGERVAAERRRVAGAGGATRAALAGCEDELHRERAALRREAAGLADETDAGDELVARLYREAAERLEQADAELAAKQRRLERRAAVGRAVAVVDVSLHACRVQKRRAAEAQRAALEELDGCGAELRAQQEAGAAAVLRLEDGVRERASELHRERMRLGEGYYKEFQRLYLTLGEVRHKKQQQYDRYDALHGDEVMRLEQCADTLNPTEEAKEHARLRDHYKAVCASLKQAVEALDTRLAVCDSPFAASVHAALRGAGRLHTHPSETLKKIVDASKQKLLLYYKDQEEISGRQKKEEAEVVAAAAAATAAAASTGAASGGATTAVVAPSPKKIEMPPPDNPPPAQPAAASEVPA